MKETYVTYETSKLLKEKGFDWAVMACYQNSEFRYVNLWNWNKFNASTLCSAPTQQMALRWLREEKNLNIDVSWDNVLNWFFQVVSLTETVQLDYEEPRVFHSSNETGFKTYEDGVEAALQYVLTNLI